MLSVGFERPPSRHKLAADLAATLMAIEGSTTAREIHAGPEVQVVEGVPQVGVHGMRRDEQSVGDSPVGVAPSSETRDLKLGVCKRLPPEFRAIQRLRTVAESI